MTTIVRYEGNGRDYILVGTGFGASMHLREGFLRLNDKGEKYPYATLSDASGKLHWVRTDQVTVVSVDGKAPSQILKTMRTQDLPLIEPPGAPAS